MDVQRSLCIRILAIMLALGSTSVLFAEEVKITQIEVDGNKTLEPVTIPLTTPLKSRRGTRLRVGDSISNGSIIEAPSNIAIVLESNDGNGVLLSPGSTLRIEIVNNKGESYVAMAGKLWFSIKKKLNFFTVSDSTQRIRASISGTNLSVALVGNQITFERGTGEILLSRRSTLNLTRQGATAAVIVPIWDTSILNSGNGSVSWNVISGSGDENHSITSIDEAIDFMTERVTYRDDSIVAAYDRTTLGYLQLESGDYSSAVAELSKAVNIRQDNLSEFNPDLADSKVILGEALVRNGEPDEALSVLQDAYSIYNSVFDDVASSRSAESYAALGALYNDIPGNEGFAEEVNLKASLLSAETLEFYTDYLDSLTSDFSTEYYAETEYSAAVAISESYEYLPSFSTDSQPYDGTAPNVTDQDLLSDFISEFSFDDPAFQTINQDFSDPPDWNDPDVGIMDLVDTGLDFELESLTEDQDDFEIDDEDDLSEYDQDFEDMDYTEDDVDDYGGSDYSDESDEGSDDSGDSDDSSDDGGDSGDDGY